MLVISTNRPSNKGRTLATATLNTPQPEIQEKPTNAFLHTVSPQALLAQANSSVTAQAHSPHPPSSASPARYETASTTTFTLANKSSSQDKASPPYPSPTNPYAGSAPPNPPRPTTPSPSSADNSTPRPRSSRSSSAPSCYTTSRRLQNSTADSPPLNVQQSNTYGLLRHWGIPTSSRCSSGIAGEGGKQA